MSTQGAVLVVLAFSLASGPAVPAQVLRPPLVDGVSGNDLFQKDLTVGDVNGEPAARLHGRDAGLAGGCRRPGRLRVDERRARRGALSRDSGGRRATASCR